MRKRLFSLLLVLAMILSFGAAAFAVSISQNSISGIPGYEMNTITGTIIGDEIAHSLWLTNGIETTYAQANEETDGSSKALTGNTLTLNFELNGVTISFKKDTNTKVTWTASGTPQKSLKAGQAFSFLIRGKSSGDVNATNVGTIEFTAADPKLAVKPAFATKKGDITKVLNSIQPMVGKEISKDETDEDKRIIIETSTLLPNTKWTLTNLPTGLSYDIVSGDSSKLQIFGTPEVTAKNQKVTVTVQNVKGSATMDFNINVGYEDDLKWNLASSDLSEFDAKDSTTWTRFDGSYYVGSDIKNGPTSYDYVLNSADLTLTNVGDMTKPTWSADVDYVISAEPGPIVWTVKNLPAGITYSVNKDTTQLTLKGKFTKASALKWIKDENQPVGGYWAMTTPATISAKNDGITTGNVKTLTRDIYMTVFDTAAVKTAKLAPLTTEKKYTQKIEFTNPVQIEHIFVKEEAFDVASPDAWHELTAEDAVETGYTFKTMLGSADAEGDAGTMIWNHEKQQLEANLTKMPAGNKINVRIVASNPKLATTSTVIDKTMNIDVNGIAPSIGMTGKTDFLASMAGNELTEGSLPQSIKLKVSKGTFPVTLTATIDKATAKTFGLDGKKDVTITNTSSDTDFESAFGLVFLSTASADETEDSSYNLGDGKSVVIDDKDGSATLMLVPSLLASGDPHLESYKGLKVTISATNDQTGVKNPVKTTYTLNLNKDDVPSFYGPVFADGTSDGGTETDLPIGVVSPDSTNGISDTNYEKIEGKSRTYNVYIGASSSFDVTFFAEGDLPLEITSPKDGETQNGIKAVVKKQTANVTHNYNNDGNTAITDTVEVPAVRFVSEKGITAKADAKFKIIAINKLSGKSSTLDLVFKGNMQKGLATEAPVIGNASTTNLFDYAGSGFINGKDNGLTIPITKGLPLQKTDTGSTTEGLRIYVDAATAKQYGLGQVETDLIDDQGEDNSVAANLGLTFNFVDTDGDDNRVPDAIVVSLDTSDLNASAGGIASYKGFPFIVEAKNNVTELNKKPVTKTFKIDVNKANTLKMMGLAVNANGDADFANDQKMIDGNSITYNAYLGTEYSDSNNNAFEFTLTGGAPIEVTSPKTGTKVNGIEITIGDVVESGDIPITFAGSLESKKDAQFTIAANNKYSGNKISFKVTFKANNPEGVAKDKPVIGNITSKTLTDGVGMTNEEVVPSADIYITKGLPLKKTADSMNNYEGLNVYVDASAAKTYSLNAAGRAEYLIENGSPKTIAKLGLTATVETKVVDGVSNDVITITFNRTNADYQSYKGLPITVEAANYVTEQASGKKPVTKAFKIDVNPNHTPKIYSGDVDLSQDITVKAYVNEKLSDAPCGEMTLTASGDKVFKLTAPAKTTTTNGIKATVNATNGTVAFSGTPLKKGKTKFTMTVENSNTKKNVKRNVTFDVVDKPLPEEPEDFDEKLGITLNPEYTLDMVVGGNNAEQRNIWFDITGHPDKVEAEIDASSAKSIFGASKAISMTPTPITSSDHGGNTIEPTGLAVTGLYTSGGANAGKFVEGIDLRWNVSSQDQNLNNVYSTAYKGAKLNVTLTRGKETLKKSFAFSLNKDDTPEWHLAVFKDNGTVSEEPKTEVAEDVTIETTAGEKIDDDKEYVPLWANDTKLEDVEYVHEASADKVIQQKLTYIVDVRKPYTVTPDSKKNTNGLVVTTTKLATQPTGLPEDGFERVMVTITGKPTKGRDTTSKIPMEIVYDGNKKKAKLTATISAFAKPENFDNPASFSSKNAKEYDVGQKFDIKPKLTINNRITPQYYITSEDKAKLDASGLKFNAETGAISGAKDETLPTLSEDNTGELVYNTAKTVTVYGFFNGTYPDSADKETGLIADGAENTVTASADVKLTVGFKVKPVTPKISTSKIVYMRNPDNDSDIDAKNKEQLIEISNIEAADLESGENGENPKAKLVYASTSALSNMKLSLASFDNGEEVWTVSGDSSQLKATKATSVPVTVYNYSNASSANKVFATKNITITVVDPKPVIDSSDTSVTDFTMTANKNAAQTVKKVYTVDKDKYWSSKETTLKWKVSTGDEKVSGVTAKIVQDTKNPYKATVTYTVKKNLATGGWATFDITVTNSVTKETSDPLTVVVGVTGTDGEAPEESSKPTDSTALPEDTTALPEDTTALPDEDVESLLPKDRMLGEGDVTLGKERTADTITDEELRQIEAILGEGYEIAAILPEVTVTADGQYDLIIDLNDKASGDVSGDVEEIALESEEGTTEETVATEKKLAGKELVWFAFPRDVEPSEDDEIVDFYDMEGHDTKVVPETYEFVVSPWFDEGVVYAPVIAVKSDNGVTEQELAGVDSADKVVEIKTTDPKVEIITEDSEDENVEELEEETEVELELE